MMQKTTFMFRLVTHYGVLPDKTADLLLINKVNNYLLINEIYQVENYY